MKGGRKHPDVSILKIMNGSSPEKWNEILAACLLSNNLNILVAMRYGIQADMDNLAKANMNTPEVVNLFLRLNNSIEKTMKKIWFKACPVSDKAARTIKFNQFLKDNAF